MPTTPAATPADLIGSFVTYHGSVTDHHGTVKVLDVCDCGHCIEAEDRARSMGYPAPAPRFELVTSWGGLLLHARRESFTVKAA